jgi:hypothetical protein
MHAKPHPSTAFLRLLANPVQGRLSPPPTPASSPIGRNAHSPIQNDAKRRRTGADASRRQSLALKRKDTAADVWATTKSYPNKFYIDKKTENDQWKLKNKKNLDDKYDTSTTV